MSRRGAVAVEGAHQDSVAVQYQLGLFHRRIVRGISTKTSKAVLRMLWVDKGKNEEADRNRKGSAGEGRIDSAIRIQPNQVIAAVAREKGEKDLVIRRYREDRA